jgi:DNA-binding response OmpR family regulator
MSLAGRLRAEHVRYDTASVKCAEPPGRTLSVATRRPDESSPLFEQRLPDGDGVGLCRRLREWSAMPLIVLSAVGDEEQKWLPVGGRDADHR